ncbi:MAG: diaminopimelate decarboxylase [Rudaea sp.]|uniref:diaminopimelate decarboxylase n=1 Tax=unclassified Rudaea TaxID=2627037 RepID=UPI0010FA3CBB|nr:MULTISPECIES: diaminopimelate decarboxylase [unclassified Rudaea]MBN8885090.1 diaminopimelate decarboxylase [Rudaea sp.]MBR0344769.1 diaminopimelate decarboxylase [Rudaea sp.]
MTESASAADALWDGVDLQAVARRVGTPCYVYSASMIRQRIDALHTALHGFDALVCYAAKANSNVAILQLMAEAGVGADIVSAGEMHRSLRAGIPAQRIVFSGVGKSADEIVEALAAGVARFNVESEDELHLLQRLAAERDVIAHAAVRVNPDVDALTHAKISTGKSENKFGVGIDEARRWFADGARLTHVRLDGLHVHIGSQMLTLDPIRTALQRVAAFWRELAAAGHVIRSIDVGGGLGVCYRPDRERPIAIDEYVDILRHALAGFGGRIVLEPGRWLVAEAGVLLTRVIRIKQGRQRLFLVIDAAMTELLRPSLYDAWHEIVPVIPEARPLQVYDIVGPVCETGDTFAVDRELPRCEAGDLLMIKTTGAYGAAMALNYNSRPLAAEVLADRGRYAVVRRRQTLEDMLAGEQRAQEWQVA